MYFYIYFTEMCPIRQLKHTDDSHSHSFSHIHFTPPSPFASSLPLSIVNVCVPMVSEASSM